ncbi:hypothetical protein GJ496_004781 [Pomphorhynchus laevis]|nr:hypothetical protein GJ496_004781 [Pomphorhynchus laevis]
MIGIKFVGCSRSHEYVLTGVPLVLHVVYLSSSVGFASRVLVVFRWFCKSCTGSERRYAYIHKFKSENRGNESESDENQLTETEIEMRVRQLLEKDISEFEELDLSLESIDYSDIVSSLKNSDENSVFESTSRISDSQNECFDNEMIFYTKQRE